MVTTHRSHHRWIGVGQTYLQYKKFQHASFHETLGGASKICTLNFKGQKDVVGEGKNQKEAIFCA